MNLLALRFADHARSCALGVERRVSIQASLLRTWLEQRVIPGFAGRILPVDQTVALRCAELHVPDRRPVHDALVLRAVP